jgi:hypothetical protein
MKQRSWQTDNTLYIKFGCLWMKLKFWYIVWLPRQSRHGSAHHKYDLDQDRIALVYFHWLQANAAQKTIKQRWYQGRTFRFAKM